MFDILSLDGIIKVKKKKSLCSSQFVNSNCLKSTGSDLWQLASTQSQNLGKCYVVYSNLLGTKIRLL